jgi:hypothetical protein
MKSSEFDSRILPMFCRQSSSGILLIPRQIYYEWSRYLIPEKEYLNGRGAELFLLPPFASVDRAEEFCSLFFDLFFQYELRKCTSDPLYWPVNRTYEMFLQWFEVKITGQVSALQQG